MSYTIETIDLEGLSPSEWSQFQVGLRVVTTSSGPQSGYENARRSHLALPRIISIPVSGFDLSEINLGLSRR